MVIQNLFLYSQKNLLQKNKIFVIIFTEKFIESFYLTIPRYRIMKFKLIKLIKMRIE